MGLFDVDDEIPKSSGCFLFFLFFIAGFAFQVISIFLGAYDLIYSPMIDWMLGGFPREGENTVILLAFLFVVGSVLFAIVALLAISAARSTRR